VIYLLKKGASQMKLSLKVCLILLVFCFIITVFAVLIQSSRKADSVLAINPSPVINKTNNKSEWLLTVRYKIQNLAILEKLNNAIVNNDLKLVRTIIREKPELVNMINNNGMAPLHIAVLNPNRKIIELLLDNGADVNLVADTHEQPGWISLNYAINSPDIVEMLVKRGADYNRKDTIGRTILHISSFRGQSEQLKTYLKLGININSIDNARRNPLHYVVRGYNCTPNSNYPETLRLLIRSGVDKEAFDASGCKPVYYSLTTDTNKICKGSDYSQALLELIKCGVDIKSPVTKDGKTALEVAKEKKIYKHVKILCKYSLDRNISK
jgi:ankyrin repeat protein